MGSARSETPSAGLSGVADVSYGWASSVVMLAGSGRMSNSESSDAVGAWQAWVVV